MPSKKISEENLRSPITFTEQVRLEAAGDNWRAPLSDFAFVRLSVDTTFYVGYFIGTIAGGSSYTNGFYTNVELTNISVAGAPTGARANILVSGNAITMVQINDGTTTPSGYAIGDILGVSPSNVGGTGSGFTFTLTGVGADTPSGGTATAPWASMQYAFNQIQSKYHFAGHTVTMQLSDTHFHATPAMSYGSGYGAMLVVNGWIGGGTFIIKGGLNNTGGRPSVMLDFDGTAVSMDNCIRAENAVGADSITIERLHLSGKSNYTFIQCSGGDVLISDCAFGNQPGNACIGSNDGSRNVTLSGNFWFVGSSPVVIMYGPNWNVGFMSNMIAVGVTMSCDRAFYCTAQGIAFINSTFYLGIDGGSWSPSMGSVAAYGYFTDLVDPDGTFGNGAVPGTPVFVGEIGSYRYFDPGESDHTVVGLAGAVDAHYGFFQPGEAGTVVPEVGQFSNIVAPSSSLSNLTVTMPAKRRGTAGKSDGTLLEFTFTKAISTITWNASDGDTLLNAPSSVTAGKLVKATYRLANTTWYFAT